ncbi:MAG: site-2 protease family protein [Planctomycetota bacterium]|jgi:RIP metalloprotease RseP|nr:site-2 protease family protein [Planctomycetota bacterium]
MSDYIPSLAVVIQVIVVIFAFSTLIFVHELGHYLAARLVGVRVERFFIGIDIFSLALKREFRGTTYGIGILPLGGYCALAGQNDDPRKERRTGAPDELQTKTLSQQALVFAGGVIMNFIFGFIVLVAAYMYGIPFIPATLGAMDPNGPAAISGLHSGDRLLRIDGRTVESFEDAAEAIAMAGSGGEIQVDFARSDEAGDSEILSARVKGRASNMRGNLNTIGVEPARSLVIAGLVNDPEFLAAMEGKLVPGDRIVAVNATPLQENQGHLLGEMLENQPGKKVELSISDSHSGELRNVVLPLETYGEFDMGLRIGVRIAGVMPGSPADTAGFLPGDLAVAYTLPTQTELHRFGSIQDFQDVVLNSALQSIDLGMLRDGQQLFATLKPRVMVGHSGVTPATDTLLGVQGQMEGDKGFRVETVIPDSPADGVVQAGDFINQINSQTLPKGMSLKEMVEVAASLPVKFYLHREEGDPRSPYPEVLDANITLEVAPRTMENYPRPMLGLDLLAGPVTAVVPDSFADQELGGIARLRGKRLTMIHYSPDLSTTTTAFIRNDRQGDTGEREYILADTPAEIVDNPLLHGLRSRLPLSLKTAEAVHPLPLIPALAAAGKKWVNLSLMVYRVIHRLIVRTLPLDAVGGPVQLFRIIKIADDRGFAYFLYIVALISVNLGVCNILPFPVLDGGHLVFLLIEWLMGRPPPATVRNTIQWIGIACLLTLMLTVTGYDILHLFRGTG